MTVLILIFVFVFGMIVGMIGMGIFQLVPDKRIQELKEVIDDADREKKLVRAEENDYYKSNI